MNEGVVSTRLGVRGIPTIAEEIVVARDLLLAEYTGARIHIAHVSTAGSVRMVREAKKRGVQVTAETCPHYFTLIDADIGMYDTNKKMNPPLRTAARPPGGHRGPVPTARSTSSPATMRRMCPRRRTWSSTRPRSAWSALKPRSAWSLTYLVDKNILMPADLVEKMSLNPNRILNLPGGTLSVGKAADITIIDPRASWKVEPQNFFSKARNTAFEGFPSQGVCLLHDS